MLSVERFFNLECRWEEGFESVGTIYTVIVVWTRMGYSLSGAKFSDLFVFA